MNVTPSLKFADLFSEIRSQNAQLRTFLDTIIANQGQCPKQKFNFQMHYIFAAKDPNDVKIPNMIGLQSRLNYRFVSMLYKKLLEAPDLPKESHYAMSLRATLSFRLRHAIAILHQKHNSEEAMRNLAVDVGSFFPRFTLNCRL